MLVLHPGTDYRTSPPQRLPEEKGRPSRRPPRALISPVSAQYKRSPCGGKAVGRKILMGHGLPMYHITKTIRTFDGG